MLRRECFLSHGTLDENIFCLQRCEYDSGDLSEHDDTSDDARRKLVCAAALSVVFMVKLNKSRINNLINRSIRR